MPDIYFSIYHISNIVFYILFGVSFLLMLFKIIMHFVSIAPAKKFPPAKKDHKFAIVIPARNESKVIHQILDSIKGQTYNHELIDTYLIVEKEDDPTCEIAKRYDRVHVFVRRHLERKGKGHAMDELFQDLLADKKTDYEAYLIFDADNILYPNFVEEMNKSLHQGYDVCIGYRNSKNWNDNWISACSGLTFSAFNTFENKPRSRLGLNVNICGTGFYISSKLLKKIGGYKFFTLTEDYEFKLYSTLNNVPTTYNEEAKFYDEQPTKLKVSWNQRLRWCKGFTQANKIYQKKILKSALQEQDGKKGLNKLQVSTGVLPLAFTIITILAYQVCNLVMMFVGLGISHEQWFLPGIGFAASGVALYIVLSLYTLILILIERKNINITAWHAFVSVLMNPIFMLLYLPIYVHSMFKKEVKWVAIEHNKLMNTATGETQLTKESKDASETYGKLRVTIAEAEKQEENNQEK